MLIIILIGSLVLYGVIFAAVFTVINNAIKERNDKAYANLPVEVLMTDVIFSPLYSGWYKNLLNIMPEDKAKKLVITKMLTDKGVIGYRKSWT